MRETLSLPWSLKESDEKLNTFSGIASVFGSLIEAPQYPTFILPGSFLRTIAERMKKGKIKICYQHDDYEPIGLPTYLEEIKLGLAFDAKISETLRGKDTLILLRDKVITEMSIGFDALQSELLDYERAMVLLSKLKNREIATLIKSEIEAFSEQTEGRHILYRFISQVKLYELSPVTWGADPDTAITEVHKRMPNKLAPVVTIHAGDSNPEKIAQAVLDALQHTGATEAKPDEAQTLMQQADIMSMCKQMAKQLVACCDGEPTGDAWTQYTQMRTLCAAIMTLMEMPAFYPPVNPGQEMGEIYSAQLEWTLHALFSSFEKFEGKVLSSKNKKLIDDCVAALQALLEAAEPREKESAPALSEQTKSATIAALSEPQQPDALLRDPETDEIEDLIFGHYARKYRS